MRKIAIYLVSRKIHLHILFAVKVVVFYMKTPAQISGSLKIKFSADKIYYNFSHEHPKISNM